MDNITEHRIRMGWKVPAGYKARHRVEVDGAGWLEIELVEGDVVVRSSGVLVDHSCGRLLDWEAEAIMQIREGLGV